MAGIAFVDPGLTWASEPAGMRRERPVESEFDAGLFFDDKGWEASEGGKLRGTPSVVCSGEDGLPSATEEPVSLLDPT